MNMKKLLILPILFVTCSCSHPLTNKAYAYLKAHYPNHEIISGKRYGGYYDFKLRDELKGEIIVKINCSGDGECVVRKKT